jgi:hypothetical protein
MLFRCFHSDFNGILSQQKQIKRLGESTVHERKGEGVGRERSKLGYIMRQSLGLWRKRASTYMVLVYSATRSEHYAPQKKPNLNLVFESIYL